MHTQMLTAVYSNPVHNPPADKIPLLTAWYRHTKHCQKLHKTFTAGEWQPSYSYSFVL